MSDYIAALLLFALGVVWGHSRGRRSAFERHALDITTAEARARRRDAQQHVSPWGPN